MGGILELAPGYLPAVYKSIRKVGGLCIADEVQSGFARTGSHFWGFEAHGVVPDIVTMAKVITDIHFVSGIRYINHAYLFSWYNNYMYCSYISYFSFNQLPMQDVKFPT